MGLELINNVLDKVKDNKFVQNFVKELSDYLEKENDKINTENINIGGLKQENCLYQVVSMDVDGVYLKNIENNRVFKEEDISKETLENICTDDVLCYKNEKYVYEEDLTNEFMDSLIDVNRYKEIQENFIRECNILDIDTNTIFNLKEKGETTSTLIYGENDSINVPNELIPFWSKEGENLYYKDGKFNRDV